MRVKDTFPYFSAKVWVVLTEGFTPLYQGPRDNIPDALKERVVEKYEYLYTERKFWIAVRPRE